MYFYDLSGNDEMSMYYQPQVRRITAPAGISVAYLIEVSERVSIYSRSDILLGSFRNDRKILLYAKFKYTRSCSDEDDAFIPCHVYIFFHCKAGIVPRFAGKICIDLS